MSWRRSPSDMIKAIGAGDEPEVNDTETYDNGVKVVPSYLLDPVTGDQGRRTDRARRLRLLHRGRAQVAPSGGPGSRTRSPDPACATPTEKTGCTWLSRSWRCAASPRSSRASRRSPTSTSPSSAVRSTRSAVRTAPASRTLMKVLSGVYPHGTYERRDPLRGRARGVHRHPAERGRRHRDHPPGARAHPRALDRGEHLPRQRDRRRAASSTGTRPTTGRSS